MLGSCNLKAELAKPDGNCNHSFPDFALCRAPDCQTASARRGAPQGSVHVDYDHLSGDSRLSELLPEEAEKLRETPFAVIQVGSFEIGKGGKELGCFKTCGSVSGQCCNLRNLKHCHL